MVKFNIKEDLEFRPDAQKLEILCISGPSAVHNMTRLVNKEYRILEMELGFKIDPKVAEKIVEKYAQRILALPAWKRNNG